jgi:hypothetical protein
MGLYSPAGEYRKNIPPYQFSIFSNFGFDFLKGVQNSKALTAQIYVITNGLRSRQVFLSRCARDNLRGQKSLGPLKMSLEMAHKVILPPKKNYIKKFLKQRDINSYRRSERFKKEMTCKN